MANFNEVQSLLTSGQGAASSAISSRIADPFAVDNTAQGGGFSQALGEAVNNFGNVQKGAQAALKHVANGSDGEVHDSMMAIEKANTTFKFGFTCLKKAIECYKEVTQRMG